MNSVKIYTTQFCSFCHRAKTLLTRKSIQFQEIAVGSSMTLRREMMELSGQYTVPQIFINDKPIGGCDELYALERSGQLDKILFSNPSNIEA